MKKKLALLLAVIMILSYIPAQGLSAASDSFLISVEEIAKGRGVIELNDVSIREVTKGYLQDGGWVRFALTRGFEFVKSADVSVATDYFVQDGPKWTGPYYGLDATEMYLRIGSFSSDSFNSDIKVRGIKIQPNARKYADEDYYGAMVELTVTGTMSFRIGDSSYYSNPGTYEGDNNVPFPDNLGYGSCYSLLLGADTTGVAKFEYYDENELNDPNISARFASVYAAMLFGVEENTLIPAANSGYTVGDTNKLMVGGAEIDHISDPIRYEITSHRDIIASPDNPFTFSIVLSVFSNYSKIVFGVDSNGKETFKRALNGVAGYSPVGGLDENNLYKSLVYKDESGADLFKISQNINVPPGYINAPSTMCIELYKTLPKDDILSIPIPIYVGRPQYGVSISIADQKEYMISELKRTIIVPTNLSALGIGVFNTEFEDLPAKTLIPASLRYKLDKSFPALEICGKNVDNISYPLEFEIVAYESIKASESNPYFLLLNLYPSITGGRFVYGKDKRFPNSLDTFDNAKYGFGGYEPIGELDEDGLYSELVYRDEFGNKLFKIEPNGSTMKVYIYKSLSIGDTLPIPLSIYIENYGELSISRTAWSGYFGSIYTVLVNSPSEDYYVRSDNYEREVPAGTLITLTTPIEGCEIYYTTDGSEPTSSVTRKLYQNPIIINESTLIRATISLPDSRVYSLMNQFYFSYIVNKMYTVTIAELKHGSITAEPTSAFPPFTSIRLTVTPDTGYKLKDGSIKYKTYYGGEAFIGTSFRMPYQDVVIEAEFEPMTQFGDVNGDGVITTADAVLLLQHIAKIITLENDVLTSADVNHDSSITTADAVLLLQYIAKIIPSLS